MENKTRALHDFLVENAENFTETWFSLQQIKTGSDYSKDAPEAVVKRIKEQNANYVRLTARSLLQTDEEMQKTISAWTSQTAADRVKSQTSLEEVVRNSGVFRQVYWTYIRKFAESTDLEITAKDVFEWERTINTTLDYVIETFTEYFMKILLNRLSSQAELIKELSAPVIALSDDLGLLPIIGDIDTTRAKQLMQSTLEQSLETRISTLVIDLSGVVMIDTMVAQQFFQLIASLKLIGVKSILTGMRPDVVQTAVQLGIDFSELQTENSLRSLLKKLTRVSN
ncbi:rsbT co-antagonist protein RsbR [Bacillus ectoiniformans]|uniref:STAS domain-containing protein n=1 Tax=Bacillus ectoiniformans TaxID=1494429 RepID=UPI00195C650D|nr:STAS domain-containing protein [Bacillus ectoiniformans]MBM7649435.1 rsbT co-antagonist protein RsbR [Bacillus ectoiniformans]